MANKSSSLVLLSKVSDLRAGRVAVLFSASGVRTVTEVKRTFTEMDHSQLLGDYGAQVAAYQTTNMTSASF